MHVDDIGKYTNEDVYTYFNYHKPIASTNEHNSSTDAVADVDAYIDDREDLDVDYNFETNIIIDDLNNNANEVPPEYANDPDLWYAMQASLKVRVVVLCLLTFVEGHLST